MNSSAPRVTVLVPARNEERDVADCLDAILLQDHPHDEMEIVLVDGDSTDQTVPIARRTLERGDVAWQIVASPGATTPKNLNAGLGAARGEYVCRVDARSVVPEGYVRRCVETLEAQSSVAVVGGRQVARPPNGGGLVERSIALALNNPYGMGLARYRRGASSGETDTVYLGAFRTADLRAVGGWDERLHTNQDWELNQRLRRRGSVWFDADLAVGYRPRSTLSELAAQYRRFGRWKAAVWFSGLARPAPRQIALVALPPLCLAIVASLLRGPRRRLLLFSGGTLAAAFITARGEPPPRGAERLFAGVALGVVASSWWCGVVEETARRCAGTSALPGP